MTSDFLVDFSDPQRPTVAIQAKYSAYLQKPNVIEQLELERRYWQEKGVPWFIVTEREVSREAFVYPAQAEDCLDESQLAQYLQQFLQEFDRSPERKLTDISQGLDIAYQLEAGQSLYWLRQLLARRRCLRRLTMLPVNQVFRMGKLRKRLLWCGTEQAI